MSNDNNFPNWAKGKIMYHIFVDRFSRNYSVKLDDLPNRKIHRYWYEDPTLGPDKDGLWNVDFYGGNLKGIIDKLGYIKSLGTGIIYLSPVVESQSNHRYDTGDYEKVDPYLGTNEDLKELCTKAHEKGMRVILDAVFNHTGNDSKYFNEFGHYPNLGAFQSKDSPYYDFYRKYITSDNVYFDYWWGMKNLPVCDGYNPKWIEYITGKGGVIDKWFSLGIDGLRLDVADELNDPFIEKIREACHRNKEDSLIIGEVWKDPTKMNRNYLGPQGMDTVMNYPLVNALIRYYKYNDKENLWNVYNSIKYDYPKDTVNALMNFTSTHDISRIISIFGTDKFSPYNEWSWDLRNNDLDCIKNFHMSKEAYAKAKEILKSYTFTLCFMPGIFSIFYGDEVGVEGLGNLDNRKPFPWEREDKGLLRHYRELGMIRNREKFLEEASMDIKNITDDYILFERENGNEKCLTAINKSDHPASFDVPKEYEHPSKVYRLKKSVPGELDGFGAITLKK